ncbi:MAG TPA: hypothetical protein VFA65_19550 [Bryobacteraceae bacterium]|nr:hypothetical protein [Bryobacteraceae bacterium]
MGAILTTILRYPGYILIGGFVIFVVSLALSVGTQAWHWFPRGGAVLSLSGFFVSVTEILLYRPARPAKFGTVSFEGLARTNRFGFPIFHPDSFPRINFNQTVTPEEIESDRQEQLRAWEEADEIGPTEGADEGHQIKELSDMSKHDLMLLKVAAIFGVVGTLVWAFGDLVGGLPVNCAPTCAQHTTLLMDIAYI